MPRAPDLAAIAEVGALLSSGCEVSRQRLALAARAVVAALASRHPGSSIEIRVPPYAAAQVGAVDGQGPNHHRGTPPNVVELAPSTIIQLAVGSLTWDDAVAAGLVSYSGAHAGEVALMLPLTF